MTPPDEGDEIVADESPTSDGAPEDPGSVDGLEERLIRLEAIVSALDSDALELEQALTLFEEGVGHVRRARDILAQAELKVEELIGAQGEEQRDMSVDPDRVDE